MDGLAIFLSLDHLFLVRVFDLLLSFIKSFLELSGVIRVIESGN